MTRDEVIEELTAAGQAYEVTEVELYGRPCRVFRNAPLTLRDLYTETSSTLPFIVYNDDRLSFQGAFDEAARIGTLLMNDYGVRRGDRVAIAMRNYPEWITAFTAATSIGAIAVAMNALWHPREMAYALNDSRPRVLIADQERLDCFAACDDAPTDIGVLAVRPNRALGEAVSDLRQAISGLPPEMPAADMLPNDDATIFYTSGSTGYPKGAVSCHRSIINALLSWELDAQVALATGIFPPPSTDMQPASLLGAPLFHVGASHAVYLASYRAQRRIVSMYKWDPEKAAELIEQERITQVTATPAMTGDLVAAAHRMGRDLSSLLLVGGGGAHRAPEQVHGINRTFSNARPNTGWGMTETNAIGTGIAGQDYVDRPESSGRVSAILDLKIVDESGNALPPRERGELLIRGTSIIRGYWNRPDANKETFVDRWLRTGDLAYVDEEGFLFLVDRIKDLVIRGGENIGCGAVEAALLEHPAIQEACVYGVPDTRLGEDVAATVYADQEIDMAELMAFLQDRLAKFEIPRYLHIVQTPLPRTASGKILKRQLRDEAASRVTQTDEESGQS